MTLFLFMAAMTADPSAGLARSPEALRLSQAWLAESAMDSPPTPRCERQDLSGFSFSPVAKRAFSEAIDILKSKQVVPLEDVNARRMLGLPNSREPLTEQYFSSRLRALRKTRDHIALAHSGYWSPSDRSELDQLTKLLQSGPVHLRPYLARGLSGRYISVSLCGPNVSVSSLTPGFPGPLTGLPQPIVLFTDGSPEHVDLEFAIF